jgi:putative membrane protein
MDYFNHGWGMGFMWLIPLLIIGILYYLDKRYANGDIDKKEYDEKSKHLSEHT